MNVQNENTAMLLSIIEDYEQAAKTMPEEVEDYEIVINMINDKIVFLRNLYNHVVS